MNTSNFYKEFKQVLKMITTIISWTLFCLLILIIAFLAYYLISTNIYAAKGEKYEPKFSLYTIVSPSMEPTIKVYDVILNTRIDDPATIKKGDIITFISTSNISKGMTVTHRVVDINHGPNGLEFKTKGDNNLSEDNDTAKAENVLGKVFIRLPQLGRLQFFLSSSGGWLIVVLIPALLVIVNDIIKIFRLNKTRKALDKVGAKNEDNSKQEFEKNRKEEIKSKLKLDEGKKIEKVFESIDTSNDKDQIYNDISNVLEESDNVINKKNNHNKKRK